MPEARAERDCLELLFNNEGSPKPSIDLRELVDLTGVSREDAVAGAEFKRDDKEFDDFRENMAGASLAMPEEDRLGLIDLITGGEGGGTAIPPFRLR